MRPIVTVFSISLLLGSLLAEIGPTPGTQPVAPVFAEADLVCNCVIEAFRLLDERPSERAGKRFLVRSIVASVRVDDVYNNPPSRPEQINLRFDEEVPTGTPTPPVSKPQRALMFLKLSSPSFYEYANPYIGAIPFTAIPLQGGEPGLGKLQAALAAILGNSDQDDRTNAMRMLEGLPELNSATLTALEPLSVSANFETATSALAVLIHAKQPGAVQKLAMYLRIHTAKTLPAAVLSIGAELAKANNVTDLPGLEELTSSDILSIQFGAMAGLRNIRSPQSARTLVQRLNDSNSNIQFFAVITLSEIFQLTGDYAPTMYAFDQNPSRYTVLWRNWAKSQGYID